MFTPTLHHQKALYRHTAFYDPHANLVQDTAYSYLHRGTYLGLAMSIRMASVLPREFGRSTTTTSQAKAHRLRKATESPSTGVFHPNVVVRSSTIHKAIE